MGGEHGDALLKAPHLVHSESFPALSEWLHALPPPIQPNLGAALGLPECGRQELRVETRVQGG